MKIKNCMSCAYEQATVRCTTCDGRYDKWVSPLEIIKSLETAENKLNKIKDALREMPRGPEHGAKDDEYFIEWLCDLLYAQPNS